jgi:type I restriction enzyme M protein
MGPSARAGFLCEAFDYLSAKPGLTTKDVKTLQERTFYGKEKKSLAYVIAIMNMILHGIEAPNGIACNPVHHPEAQTIFMRLAVSLVLWGEASV